MKLKQKIELTKNLEYSIRYLRLNEELKLHLEEAKKNSPEVIAKNENVFKQMYKNTKNVITKDTYTNHLKTCEIIKNRLEDLNEYAIKEKLELYEDDILKEKVAILFEEDKYLMGKLEFAMNIILDNYIDYEYDEKTFVLIAKYLGCNDLYLKNLKKEMKNGYAALMNSHTESLKDACIVAGIIGAPLLIAGVGGFVSGALYLGLGLCASSAALAASSFTVTYFSLDKIQKEELKKEFAKLSPSDTALSLTKTIILLRQINNYIDEEEAKELYESYIEEYVDLKSDVDIRLFAKREDISQNDKKNVIFHNADKYLKKELKLA